MVDFSITVPERDLVEFRRVMGMLQTKLGKVPDKAVEIAATFVVRALHGSTKVSAKLRPVKKSPDPRAGKDARIALFGVWRLRQKDAPKWLPIYGTGEFGRIRYLSKKQAIDRVTGITMDTGTDEFQIPGIMQSPKRIIGHRGLARRMWSTANIKLSGNPLATTGATTDDRIANSNMLVERRTGEDAAITLTNRLDYAMKSFRSNGKSTIDNSMRRASNAMRKFVERQTGEIIAQENKA